MKSLTLELDDRHAAALESLAAEMDMSKAAVLRQSLRLYQMVHLRLQQGEELAFTKNGVVVPQVVVGLSSFEATPLEVLVAKGSK